MLHLSSFFLLSCSLFFLFVDTNGSWYDSGTTSFSSQGRIYQVEYASKAISIAKPILGMVTSQGVVMLGVRSVTSSLEETAAPSFGEKVHEVDSHIVVAVTGMAADAPALVDRCRELCAAHRKQYGGPIPVRRLTTRLADTFQAFTHRGGMRPFGVSFLVAGHDEERGFQLYAADPSGNFDSWQAMAMGAGADKIVKGLETVYEEQGDSKKNANEMSLTLGKALETATELLKSVEEDKSKLKNNEAEILVVEVGLVLFSEKYNKPTIRILKLNEIQHILSF